MEEKVGSGGQLKDMLLAARIVDQGLVELEKMFMSVEGLMPDEINKEAALQEANTLFNEVKEIEENVCQLRNVYKDLYEATKAENEKADLSIKCIQDGIYQIEDTLKKYGYDSSKMPDCIPEDMEKNGSIPENSESSEDEVNIEVADELPQSPEREINSMSESLLGLEITPMVLSAKLRENSQGRGGVSSSSVTPGSFKCSIIPIKYLSPTPISNNPVDEKRQSNLCSKKLLEKPERPVLSLDY